MSLGVDGGKEEGVPGLDKRLVVVSDHVVYQEAVDAIGDPGGVEALLKQSASLVVHAHCLPLPCLTLPLTGHHEGRMALP